MPKPTPFAIGAHLQTWKLRLLKGFRFDMITGKSFSEALNLVST